MKVRHATDMDKESWDTYVIAHADATFYHQYDWRTAITQNYSLVTHYLLAEDAERIVGILPLAEIRPFTGRRVLISLPFANYGGVLADSAEAATCLLDKAETLVNSRKLAYLEMKQNQPLDHPGLKDKLHYFSLVLALSDDPEIVWKEKLNTKVRNQVRKAQKSGLSCDAGSQYMQDFIAVYQKNMRDLGTPTHKRCWYETLARLFPGNVEFVVVTHAGSIIAAALLLRFKKTLIFHSAASNKKHLHLCPNNMVYWKSIELACLQGYERLDFGRSRENSGTFHFKRQWGAEPEQTYYQYFLMWTPTMQSMPRQLPYGSVSPCRWQTYSAPSCEAASRPDRKPSK